MKSIVAIFLSAVLFASTAATAQLINITNITRSSSIPLSASFLGISNNVSRLFSAYALVQTNESRAIVLTNQANIIGGSIVASQLRDLNFVGGFSLFADGAGNFLEAATTSTEISYVHGVTSGIQSQMDSKQATGNYITALAGDVTASGPGSASATLATVATPGTSTKITYNAKGLVTSGTTLSAGDLPALTSAQLRGVLSDETGGGVALFDGAIAANIISLTSSNVIGTNSANFGSNGVAPSGITLNAEGHARVTGTLSVSNAFVLQGNAILNQNLNVGGSLFVTNQDAANHSMQFANGVLTIDGSTSLASSGTDSVFPGKIQASGDVISTNGQFVGAASGLTNYYATNIIQSLNADLAPTSNQTNYTIDLLPGGLGNPVTIFGRNTNFFLTFTGTNNAGWQRTVYFDCHTNTPISSIKYAQALQTNINCVAFVTNGWTKVMNFWNPDNRGTNLVVSDAGPNHF